MLEILGTAPSPWLIFLSFVVMRKCGCVRGLDRAGGEKPSLIKGVWTVR
jgi:hypothetical protein